MCSDNFCIFVPYCRLSNLQLFDYHVHALNDSYT